MTGELSRISKGRCGAVRHRKQNLDAMKSNLVLLAIGLVCSLTLSASADEKLAGLACRSVHLGYSAPAGTAFYNEVIVDKSAPGTYFCVCGFNHGYFGIQQIDDKKKVAI